MKNSLFVLSLFVVLQSSPIQGQTYLESFDDIGAFSDWFFQNNSSTPDQNWHQGNTVQFDSYEGGANSYVGVGFQSSSSSIPVTLSNWLLSKARTFNNGDIITFYTRSMDVSPVFPDRLEVRFSEDGNNTNVGFAPEDVGSFTTVLLSINPTLSTTGYPTSWTQYTITISGLSGPTNGRLGFRYYVTNGGPGGNNSNYIGIDSFTYYSTLSPPTNDNCASADSIDHAAACSPVNGSLQVATESLLGCDGVANNDVWYQFTANSNATSIELNGSSEMDAVVEIYSGSCASLSSMSCLNATYDGGTESTTINGLIPGEDYFIRVYDWYESVPNTMDFSLCVESFDQCNIDAGINSTVESEACGDNINGGCFVANPEYQNVTCHETVFGSSWSENGLKDYDWYRFEIFEAGISALNVSSEFPVSIDVYNIENCTVPQLIESNNFNSCGQNTIELSLPSGTYAAVVYATSGNDLLCGSFNEYEIGFTFPESDVTLNLSGSIEFCEDSPLEIYSDQEGGLFDWIQNGTSISSSDTLYLNSSGPLYLAYTNQNGCPSDVSETLDILMNPLNSAGFTYGSTELCLGNGIVTPTADNQGVFSASGGLEINTANGAINTDNAIEGVYLITHETEGTCPDSVSAEITLEDCSSLDENELLFSIEPNPCQHELIVHSSFTGEIFIYSSLGELVSKGLKVSSSKLRISTENIDPGVYFVVFKSGTKQSSLKLIKL